MMNQSVYQDKRFKRIYEKEKLDESQTKKRAKFACECRTMRLWLAAHPNQTSLEVFKGTGIKVGYHLMKMRGMGIVNFTQLKELDGRAPQRWFVIPQ